MAAASSDASQGLAFSFNPANRIKKFAAPTVWHEFTPLAQQVKAVNLGQGFPGWEAPQLMKDANIKATLDNHNQYARSQGHLALCQEVAKRYSEKVFEGKRTVDPLTEVAITTGASEALFAIEHGLINPGDEVVTFEPAFDLYIAQTDMAGGILKTVPIRRNPHSAASDKLAANSEWFVDWDEFEKVFSAKTRMVILNTPHNPTGKVFSREELTKIASIVKKYPNVVVVADEVYENMTFDGRPHISIATLDGMWDRSVTISSAGKTFSVTGWKVGWVVGPAHLVRCVGITHQWVSFSTANPVQEAVAIALKSADAPYQSFPTYYDWLHDFYTRKRTILVEGLKAAGLKPIVPEGSFFVMADTSDVVVPDEYLNDKSVTRDWALARFFTKEIGVCCIPPSAFYGNDTKHLAENLVRFAFCQPDDRLNEACNRLLKVRNHLKK